jgi:hypothetical protein
MWNIQVYGLSSMLLEKECFNLYSYIRFWNVVDWSAFFVACLYGNLQLK